MLDGNVHLSIPKVKTIESELNMNLIIKKVILPGLDYVLPRSKNQVGFYESNCYDDYKMKEVLIQDKVLNKTGFMGKFMN